MSSTSPFLPHLSGDLLEKIYRAAAGNEWDSGKMLSSESSSALVANAFGLFIGDKAHLLPPLPGTEAMGWPATDVRLEHCVRFPWSGGRHPWLDVVVETSTHIIGIESKRFEPFRSKPTGRFAQAYWRPVWGDRMSAFERVRDALRDNDPFLNGIDAVQLVKHAFGLVSEVARRDRAKRAVLVYLYAEPRQWPGGKLIAADSRVRHVRAIQRFGSAVIGDEVEFLSLSYRQLLGSWRRAGSDELVAHAEAVERRFLDLGEPPCSRP